MRLAGCLLLLCVVTVLAWPAAARGAEDRETQYLHALQDQGYADVAVDYLKLLQQQPDTPAALKDVFDLEMYRSLKAAAKDAYNPQEYEKLMADAQSHLTKFIKEQPKHPESLAAMSYWGNFSTDRALKYLRAAQTATDANEKAKFLADARAALEEARGRFKEAMQQFNDRLTKMGPAPKGKPVTKQAQQAADERAALDRDALNARFQACLVDYYVAQTYPSVKDDEAVKVLKTAAAGFDAIWQDDRLGLLGLIGHMWHGKTLQDLGKLNTALEVYDEVLGNMPNPGEIKERNPTMDSLFSQVEHFRLQILQQKKPEDFFDEGSQWLEAYKPWAYTDGYQAIALDLAKAYLAAAEKLGEKDQQRKKCIDYAVALLRGMAKVRSQYQTEALGLLKQHGAAASKTAVGAVEPGTAEEAIALGDAAFQDRKWDDAIAQYQRAIGMYQKARAPKDKEKAAPRIQDVRNGIANTIYMQAHEQLAKGKATECIETTKTIIREADKGGYKDCTAAPQASALACKAALHLYMTAKEKEEKEAALEQMIKIADFTASTWPDKPEADDCRLTLAKSLLIQTKIDEALKKLDDVKDKSESYGEALQLAGRTYWYRYAVEKQKPEKDQNKAAMDTDRETAVKRLAESVSVQSRRAEAGKPFPRLLVETQRLLAETAIEGKKFEEAAKLLQPLVDAVKTDKENGIDEATLKVFVAAVRAYVALGQLEKAAGAGMVLAEFGPDIPVVNTELIAFTNQLNLERKQAEARLTEAIAENDQQKAEAARARVNFTKEQLGKLVVKLLPREHLSLPAKVLVADTCMVADRDLEARDLYERILKAAADDKSPTVAKAMVRVRSQLVGLLKKEGKYDAAMTQVDEILKTNPNALEPLMEQGRILQVRAEKDPQQFAKAQAHWVNLCNKLQPMKQRPKEYYEVVLNLSTCKHTEAVKLKEKDKDKALELARQAEGLLKSVLVRSPELDGPDTKAKYKALADKLALFQGRKPEKPPAPPPPAKKSAGK